MTTPEIAAAFLSYAHKDDEDLYGAITKFRDGLTKALQLYLGRDDLEVFQDRASIRWGEQWARQIDDSLSTALIFIPILTPRYFESDPCRDEASVFLARQREVGGRIFVKPVYFVDGVGARRTVDELAKTLLSYQYVDWRELRLQSNARRRREIDNLGRDIADALRTGGGAAPERDDADRPPATTAALAADVAVVEEEGDDDEQAATEDDDGKEWEGSGYLMPGEVDGFDLWLSAGESYDIAVTAADETVDLDLTIRDGDGRIVAQDVSESSDAFCQYVPAVTQFFTLEVSSARGASDYQLLVKESAESVEDDDEILAGWYLDPSGRYEMRYWDGSSWTEQVASAGQTYTDPPIA